MLKLSRFFQNVVKSFTSVEFYKQLLKTPFSFALKYFLFLVFLVSLIYSTQISFAAISGANYLTDKAGVDITNRIPSSFVAEFKNGHLTTSLPQPFIVPVSSLDPNASAADLKGKQNILVVDTSSSFSAEKFQNYNTVAWLTATSFVGMDPSKGKITIVPFKDMGNLVINKKTLGDFLSNNIIPFLKKFIPFILPGIYLVVFFGMSLGRFIYLLFVGFVVYLLTKISKHNLTYSKSLELSIFASTLPFLVNVVGFFFGFTIPIPFWHLLLTLIILFYFLNKSEVSFPRLPCKGKRESI